jgi:hypothetical protein
MTMLDDIFHAPNDAVQHPRARWWKARLDAGDEMAVEVHRPETRFGSSRTELVVLRKENGKEQSPESFEWDDELNAALVGLGVRAVNLPQEGERFALGLRFALRKVERRFGDGYLNAVLVDLINESNLSQGGEIAAVMAHVYTNSPERTGRSYSDCRDLIANEIGGRAVELREKLKYGPEDLKTVMTKALAQYLDERFSVSSRRYLGLR